VDAQTERLFVSDYRTGLVSVLDARSGHRALARYVLRITVVGFLER
jgi:hypothetical protein